MHFIPSSSVYYTDSTSASKRFLLRTCIELHLAFALFNPFLLASWLGIFSQLFVYQISPTLRSFSFCACTLFSARYHELLALSYTAGNLGNTASFNHTTPTLIMFFRHSSVNTTFYNIAIFSVSTGAQSSMHSDFVSAHFYQQYLHGSTPCDKMSRRSITSVMSLQQRIIQDYQRR